VKQFLQVADALNVGPRLHSLNPTADVDRAFGQADLNQRNIGEHAGPSGHLRLSVETDTQRSQLAGLDGGMRGAAGGRGGIDAASDLKASPGNVHRSQPANLKVRPVFYTDHGHCRGLNMRGNGAP
jgi:hypothetical protein